jgi:hypothetical protein
LVGLVLVLNSQIEINVEIIQLYTDQIDNIIENNGNKFDETSITISASCMQGYKSTLCWFNKEKQETMDSSIDEWIDTFITGYKKSNANKNPQSWNTVESSRSIGVIMFQLLR